MANVVQAYELLALRAPCCDDKFVLGSGSEDHDHVDPGWSDQRGTRGPGIRLEGIS